MYAWLWMPCCSSPLSNFAMKSLLHTRNEARHSGRHCFLQRSLSASNEGNRTDQYAWLHFWYTRYTKILPNFGNACKQAYLAQEVGIHSPLWRIPPGCILRCRKGLAPFQKHFIFPLYAPNMKCFLTPFRHLLYRKKGCRPFGHFACSAALISYPT